MLATTGAGTFRLARDWRTHGARAASRRVPRSRMDPPGAPSGSGRGEKRPASDPADASELFKRGGPKSIRASAAPRADAGNRRPAGDAEGAGDDGRRLCATSADADDENIDGAVLEGAHAHVSGGTATESVSVVDGGSLSSRPRLLAKFKSRRLSSNADNVTVAVWRSELGVAEVLRPRGKHMNRMGYALGAQTFLFPEEIAFLVETERAALLRSKNDREPLSLRAARALCVAGHSRTNESRKISSDLYLVYAHLARRGYVVRRFGAPWNAESKNDASPQRFARNKSDHACYTGAGSVWREDANDTTCDTIKTETNDEIDETETHIYERNANQSSIPAWYPSKRRWLTPNADETAETARDEKVFSAKKKPPSASASEGRASMCVASPAFRAYAPNGNFSKKNPGEPLFYVFLERRSEKEHSLKNGATKTKTKTTSSPSAPSFRAAAAAAAALRREVGEAHLEGKVAWASVAGGVVVLHGFEDIRQ